MLSGLQGDATRLHDLVYDPIALAVPVTDELLFVMSVIFAVPILMSVLSLVLRDQVNRLANRIVGTFLVTFDLVFLGLLIFLWWPVSVYEMLWAVMYVVFTASIAWYAWRWPQQEA